MIRDKDLDDRGASWIGLMSLIAFKRVMTIIKVMMMMMMMTMMMMVILMVMMVMMVMMRKRIFFKYFEHTSKNI